VHDADIVATMQMDGARWLLTINAVDFRRFVGIIELESLPAI
jgi:hypothetical protein